jgi:hypothetical protein
MWHKAAVILITSLAVDSTPVLQNWVQAHQPSYSVTCTPVGRQQLYKHIPALANARKNRTFIAWQRIHNYAPLIIETVFSMGSVWSGYKEVFGSIEQSLKSETVKYDRETRGTRSRGRLRWQGPVACKKHRPILSSERANHKKQDR